MSQVMNKIEHINRKITYMRSVFISHALALHPPVKPLAFINLDMKMRNNYSEISMYRSLTSNKISGSYSFLKC